MKRRQFVTTAALAGLPFISKAENGYLKPGGAEYESARQLFNSDLDLKPAYIARCRNENEVVRAVKFAREEKLAVSVKSGGHSFIGASMSEGPVRNLIVSKKRTRGTQSERK